MDLNVIRRNILMNTPHLETVQSGNTQDSTQIAHFKTDLTMKLKECKVTFNYIQAGSGSPSPSNVRAISGRTGIIVKRAGGEFEPYKGNDYDISWQSEAGDIYSGYIDLVTGTLVKTHKLITLTGSEPNANKSWDSYTLYVSDIYAPNNTGYYITACSHTDNVITGGQMWSSTIGNGGSGNDVAVAGTQTSQIRYRDRNHMPSTQSGATLEDYRAYIKSQYDNGTPIQIVAKLITPVTYQLTPLTIKTLKGINNIWSDAGDVEVKYYRHNISLPEGN